MIVDVIPFHKGERWFGFKFKLPKYDYDLQVYGSTQAEADNRLIEYLDKELGYMNYSINRVTNAGNA